MGNTMRFLKQQIAPFIPTLRIRSVVRISLDMELHSQFERLAPGAVLDVGSKHSPYRKYIPHTSYMRLDIDESSKPDICCDLYEIKWSADYFDTVIATEVLEHLYEPQKAVDEIHRVLKPGGICILSTRFIHRYHPDPKDFYRFTRDSLNYLFRGFSKVEVSHHGNAPQALWHILSDGKARVVLNVFNPLIARIRSEKTTFPCGFVVYAQK